MDTLKQTISNIRLSFDDLQQDTFKKVFTNIDQLGIKQGVDKLGLERFIEQCARLSATTGVISGGGGALTMGYISSDDEGALVTRAEPLPTFTRKVKVKKNFGAQLGLRKKVV